MPGSGNEATGEEGSAGAHEAPDVDARVDGLIAAGRHGDAAAVAREAGRALRAAELYERIWEFALAADCAREAGDPGRALQNAVDARDEALVEDLARMLDEGGEAGLRTALEVFERKRRFADAARRAEALGELDRAVDLYGRAHADLDAARLLQAQGRDREAGRLLENFIELGAGKTELARARLALGLILARRMNHEAAAPHLQEAARHEETRAPAQRALIEVLAAMGLRDAARDVLVAARAAEPDLPGDIETFLRRSRESADREPEARQGGEVIGGRYRLDALVGAGSTGRVFRGRDEVSGRDCAIKLFHMVHTPGNEAYERFVRETRLAGTLRHANLVEMYDFSAEQGYLVMELMSGSLAERLAARPLGGPAARRLALDLAAGLELAHQRGVIHRDVKPANIFFDARGTAKLGDFGVAHLLDLGQTQTGGLIGTLAYMAPEQITGAPLTIAADLYSLGVTLFEALCGRLPFLGPDFVAQHLGEAPPAPSSVSAGLAPGWDAIVLRLLQKNPDDRYRSMDDLRGALIDLDLGEATRPRVLVLHRAGAAGGDHGEHPGEMSEPDRHDEVSGQEDAPRYQYETLIGETDISRLSRAVDTVLGRSVIIERYAGPVDEPTERRLYALARGGGPFLQRALSYDRDRGVAIFEAPSGVPLAEAFIAGAPPMHQVLRLLKRLARAVAPLHDSHNAHGALRDSTVLMDEDGMPTVLVCGLGRAVATATPASDVAAILELTVRLVPAPGSGGSAGSPAHALLAAVLPATGHDAAVTAALRELARPRTGEELYTFADALEVAMLRSRAS